MHAETTLGLLALAWLVVAFLLMARNVREGRHLAEQLAARHPPVYESLGRPRPGYFESPRRTRFARFVGKREFEALGDPGLAAEFEAFRKGEARLLLSIMGSGALVALVGLLVQHSA